MSATVISHDKFVSGGVTLGVLLDLLPWSYGCINIKRCQYMHKPRLAGGGVKTKKNTEHVLRVPCPRLIRSCLDLASPTGGRIVASFDCSLSDRQSLQDVPCFPSASSTSSEAVTPPQPCSESPILNHPRHDTQRYCSSRILAKLLHTLAQCTTGC